MPLLADLIRLLAKKLVHCDPSELVLVENCTYAFNSVLNGLNLQPGDKVVTFSTSYGSYKKILRAECAKKKAFLIEETIKFPIQSKSELLLQFVSKIEEVLTKDMLDKRIKYIFIDHIPSNTPFLVPVKEMSNLCKSIRPDIVFIVDGAHSLGSVANFSMKELPNVDIFFGNCHKWLCGPKGTAVLFKNKQSTFIITPAVQSHGVSKSFISEFIWSGLRQYSTYLGNFLLTIENLFFCCPNCIQFFF